MSAALRLEVVGGRQRGASVALEAGASLVLGRALDADIVLREPGLAPRALRLDVHADGRGVALEVLADGVRVNEVTSTCGDAATLEAGATMTFDALVLTIAEAGGTDAPSGSTADEGGSTDVPGSRDAPPTEGGIGDDGADASDDAFGAALGHALDDAFGEGADAAAGGDSTTDGTVGASAAVARRDSSSPFVADADPDTDTVAADGTDTTPSGTTGPGAVPVATAPPTRRSFVSLGSVTVLVCLALAGWLWYAGEGVAEGPSLAARLEGRFPALAIERRANGGPLVRGFVATRGEAIALERWLAAQPERPASAVLVDTDLAERVEDVFRINGVEATVRSLVAGAAVVDTRAADADALARLEIDVREDVPQLVALTIENTPPPPPEDIAPEDPGKRVELVVATEPAYVVTRDRSRYFVGALLPSGHRIAGIEEGVVHLVRNDVATELRF